MLLCIFTALFVLTFHFLWRNSHFFNRDLLKDFSKTNVPLIKVGFFFVFLPGDKIFDTHRKIYQKYKKSIRTKLFSFDTFSVYKGREAEKILGDPIHHQKKGLIYNFLHPFVKEGLLTSYGEKWHTRRRMLTPAFHFNVLKEYIKVFREQSVQLVERLRDTNGAVVDIVPISTQFSLTTICESTMGVNLNNLGNDGKLYRKNIYEIGKMLIQRLYMPWLHSDFMYKLFGYQQHLDDILQPVHHFTQSILDKRRAGFVRSEEKEMASEQSENVYMSTRRKRYAMMDTMLQAQAEGLIDDEGIIEETDSFTFAGHDTTSLTMKFCLLLLGLHQDIQERLFEEIMSVSGGGDELTIEDFNKMSYMDWVLKETLRLYPPVPCITREMTEDLEYEGEIIPKGTIADVFIYDIHRDPEYFPDPEKFDPERFSPENSKDRNNFTFIPFSAGKRNCIGQRFAVLELKVMLTSVIKKFQVVSTTKREDLTFVADIILHTDHPVEMQFLARTS